MNNVQVIDYEVKGITTIGGKTTTQDVHDKNTDEQHEDPPVIDPNKLVGSKEVLTENQPQKTNEPFFLPSSENAEDKEFPIILGRPFLAIARAMIDMFNKKITLRVGDDEVIFDVDQSIKRPTTKDDECFRIDDLDDTVNEEAQELLENEEPDSFLSRGLEKTIDQSNLEYCESADKNNDDDFDSKNPIRRINFVNIPYQVVQEITERDEVKSEHLYSASANEIDEMNLRDENCRPRRYAYLHGDKSFSVIISSKLSEKEKMSLFDFAVGAVLGQRIDRKFKPIYYASKTLNNAQEHYITTEKELLA
ncbi:reverse transcriptase domain-containing protein, partial [Tanacetum coccineum]